MMAAQMLQIQLFCATSTSPKGSIAWSIMTKMYIKLVQTAA